MEIMHRRTIKTMILEFKEKLLFIFGLLLSCLQQIKMSLQLSVYIDTGKITQDEKACLKIQDYNIVALTNPTNQDDFRKFSFDKLFFLDHQQNMPNNKCKRQTPLICARQLFEQIKFSHHENNVQFNKCIFAYGQNGSQDLIFGGNGIFRTVSQYLINKVTQFEAQLNKKFEKKKTKEPNSITLKVSVSKIQNTKLTEFLEQNLKERNELKEQIVQITHVKDFAKIQEICAKIGDFYKAGLAQNMTLIVSLFIIQDYRKGASHSNIESFINFIDLGGRHLKNNKAVVLLSEKLKNKSGKDEQSKGLGIITPQTEIERIVSVSPSASNYQGTLQTLKFISTIKQHNITKKQLKNQIQILRQIKDNLNHKEKGQIRILKSKIDDDKKKEAVQNAIDQTMNYLTNELQSFVQQPYILNLLTYKATHFRMEFGTPFFIQLQKQIIIEQDKNRYTLRLQNEKIFLLVNGKIVVGDVQLKHKDRIFVEPNKFYMMKIPTRKMKGNKMQKVEKVQRKNELAILEVIEVKTNILNQYIYKKQKQTNQLQYSFKTQLQSKTKDLQRIQDILKQTKSQLSTKQLQYHSLKQQNIKLLQSNQGKQEELKKLKDQSDRLSRQNQKNMTRINQLQYKNSGHYRRLIDQQQRQKSSCALI